jgi:hypothetical protein
MTDGIYAERDVSDLYSQGQAIQVVSKPHNLYGIKMKNAGGVPSDLSGSYTAPSRALQAVDSFIAKRRDYNAFLLRKKEAKRTVETED